MTYLFGMCILAGRMQRINETAGLQMTKIMYIWGHLVELHMHILYGYSSFENNRSKRGYVLVWV